jgi:phosphopantetheinyl transferase
VNAPEDRLARAIEWMPRIDSTLRSAVLADTGQFGESELLDCVSAAEAEQASRTADAAERRHFLMRRSFQRSFTRAVTGWRGRIADLPMSAARDQRPRCDAAPGLCLSFSSSGPLALASASSRADVGVDIEFLRPIDNALELAARFFAPREAEQIAAMAQARRSQEFQRYWTIKEACLKAAEKGVVYGLRNFGISPAGAGYAVEPPPELGHARDWEVFCLGCPQGFIATLARRRKPKEPKP